MKRENNFTTLNYGDNEKSTFYKAHHEFMESFGCYYLSYFLEDRQKNIRIGFTSSSDWESVFLNQKLIESCHLRNLVVKQFVNSKLDYFILPWDTTSPETKLEKDIYLYRKEFYIGSNGISFCTRKDQFLEYIALAPEDGFNNFSKHVVKSLSLIKKHVINFRSDTKNLFNLEK